MSHTIKIADLIHNEHIKTMLSLQGLDALLRKNSERKPPSLEDPGLRKSLESIVRMLAADIQCHFGFEENHLFPILAGRGQGDITAFLTEEHASIRPLARIISELAATALERPGFNEETWKDFHGLGMELCEREFFHIQKEEMGLLAAIGMFIDDETDLSLSATYLEMMKDLAA